MVSSELRKTGVVSSLRPSAMSFKQDGRVASRGKVRRGGGGWLGDCLTTQLCECLDEIKGDMSLALRHIEIIMFHRSIHDSIRWVGLTDRSSPK